MLCMLERSELDPRRTCDGASTDVPSAQRERDAGCLHGMLMVTVSTASSLLKAAIIRKRCISRWNVMATARRLPKGNPIISSSAPLTVHLHTGAAKGEIR